MEYVRENSHKDKLEDAVEYEYSMLQAAFDRAQTSKTSGDQIGQNLYLESFLLHAMNLIDFLKGNSHNGHFSIRDFKDKIGKKMNPIKLDFDKNFISKIHDHCRHLSKKRLTHKYSWYTGRIKSEISNGIEEFYNTKGEK